MRAALNGARLQVEFGVNRDSDVIEYEFHQAGPKDQIDNC